MKNREKLLRQKAEEIRKQLVEWSGQNNILTLGEKIEFSLAIKRVPIVSREEREELLARPIEDLGLSVRSQNSLQVADIYTIGELINKSVDDLFKIRNFGETCLIDVMSNLKKIGLKLNNQYD